MVQTIVPKLHIYRQYKLDIWGLSYTSFNFKLAKFFWSLSRNKRLRSKFLDVYGLSLMNKTQREFFIMYEKRRMRLSVRHRRYIYRLDTVETYKKRKYHDERFISVRVTRLYFRLFKDFQFRKLFKRATKLDGNLESNYCYLLECRLSSILYRSNFLVNMFDIPKYIEKGHVLINNRIIDKSHYLLPIGEFLTFSWDEWPKLMFCLCQRLRQRVVQYAPPRFLFISYQLNFLYLLRYPMKRDLGYPIYVDIQRLTGYY